MNFLSSYPRFQCVESFKVRCAKNRKSECSLALRCLVRVDIRSTLLAPWVYNEGFSPQFYFSLRLSFTLLLERGGSIDMLSHLEPCLLSFVLYVNVLVLVLAIYAIYSHLSVFTAPWDHLDVVVRLDSLWGDQRSLLL